MDTREKKTVRRSGRPTQTGKAPSGRRAASAPPRRRKATSSASQRSQRKAAVERRRRPAPNRTRRVVKPPREDIPGVIYTMPAPLHRGGFLLRLVSVAAVVVALMMAVSIFFRVDTVTVLGAEKYTAWDVSQASGIQEGDGLLTLSRARAAGKIRAALPYVSEVKITVTLPGTVNIEIREHTVSYAIAARDNSWWLIGADGDAIEQVASTAVSDYTRVLGVQVDGPRVGVQVSAAPDSQSTDESTQSTDDTQTGEASSEPALPLATQPLQTNAQRLEAALSILQSLERNGVIGQVASVDVQSLSDIRLQYGQRFQVRLGTTDELDYKIRYMEQAISQMEDYQTGELDVSFEFGQEGIFTPEV